MESLTPKETQGSRGRETFRGQETFHGPLSGPARSRHRILSARECRRGRARAIGSRRNVRELTRFVERAGMFWAGRESIKFADEVQYAAEIDQGAAPRIRDQERPSRSG